MRGPCTSIHPTTSLPMAIGKLTRIASALYARLDKVEAQVDDIGGMHKNGWTDIMHQIWRRYRSYPMPSLGDGVALERHEEAEWIHAHWE
eukprot:3977075-Amphidinium_carterae.1